MSWEVQGRQFHQWFGHGTGDGVADVAGVARVDRTEDVAGAVGAAAIAALGAVQGRVLAGVLAGGGAEDLAAALPIWVAASGLAANQFRALMVGPGFGVAGSASLQAMARGLAGAGKGVISGSDIKDAGAQLAAALGGERQAEWGYKLNSARDVAEYATADGSMPTMRQTNLMLEGGGGGISSGSATYSEGSETRPLVPRKALLVPVAWSPKRQSCHERCLLSSVGRGYGSDAPFVYGRCVAQCMGE